MATVTRETIANLHEKLVVKITKEDYFPSFEKSLKQASKKANVPGFRKGNVPAGMLKKMYGPSIYMEEVIRTANQELSKFMQTEKPNIFAQPLPMEDAKFNLDMNNPQDYEFSFEMGVKPPVDTKILDDKKGSLNRYKIAIEDKMLDEEILNIRKRAGKIENPDTLENDTDIVYVTYQMVDADGNAIEGKEPNEDVITLEKMPASLKAKLTGAKAETSFVFQPATECTEGEIKEFLKDSLKQNPEDQEAATANYRLTLTKVGRIQERDLDEAFFEEVFPGMEVKDEATFREKIKEEMGKEVSRIGTDRLQNDIFETLVHQTEIEIPTAFLRNWLKKGGEKMKTDEEVDNEWSAFEHQLRWTLISDQLVQDFGIQVSYDEVKDEMKNRVLAYFGNVNEDEAPWLGEYLEKMMKDENTLNETYRRLLFDKLFEQIAEKMEVTEKEVSLEEFQKLPSAHAHAHAH